MKQDGVFTGPFLGVSLSGESVLVAEVFEEAGRQRPTCFWYQRLKILGRIPGVY